MSADIKSEIGKSLSRLAECIGELGLDASSLNRYPQQVLNQSDTYKIFVDFTWYSEEKKPDKVRPSDADCLEISLSFQASFTSRSVDMNADCDPFSEMQADISMRCIGDGGEYHFAWHIDRHGFANQPGEENAPAALHPCYHVQAGGKALRAKLDGDRALYGSVLLVESPRIPMPPMDPVLVIDFVFSQFDGKSWQELRKKEMYKDVVRQSQQRYWRRYYAAMHRHFACESGEWDPLNLHPGLVSPQSRRVTW